MIAISYLKLNLNQQIKFVKKLFIIFKHDKESFLFNI